MLITWAFCTEAAVMSLWLNVHVAWDSQSVTMYRSSGRCRHCWFCWCYAVLELLATSTGSIFFLPINILKFRIWRHVCLLDQCGMTASTCLHYNPRFHLSHIQSFHVSGRCRCFARLLSVVSWGYLGCWACFHFSLSYSSCFFYDTVRLSIAWSVGVYFLSVWSQWSW